MPSQRHPLQVEQVHEEHGAALQQVEPVTGESPALGHEHALGAALWNLDFRREGVGFVENARGIAMRNARQLAGIGEQELSGREIGTRGKQSLGYRGIQRQDLILGCLDPKQLLQFAEFLRIRGSEVVELCPVFRQVVQLPLEGVGRVRGRGPVRSQGGRSGVVLAIQPS